MSNRQKMSDNGRLEKCILQYFMAKNWRGTPKKAHTYVLRNYSNQATQQNVSKRIFWMAREKDGGFLEKLHRAGGQQLFMVREDKRMLVEAILDGRAELEE